MLLLKLPGCQLMMETTGEEGKEDGACDEMICKLLTCVHVLMMRRWKILLHNTGEILLIRLKICGIGYKTEDSHNKLRARKRTEDWYLVQPDDAIQTHHPWRPRQWRRIERKTDIRCRYTDPSPIELMPIAKKGAEERTSEHWLEEGAR